MIKNRNTMAKTVNVQTAENINLRGKVFLVQGCRYLWQGQNLWLEHGKDYAGWWWCWNTKIVVLCSWDRSEQQRYKMECQTRMERENTAEGSDRDKCVEVSLFPTRFTDTSPSSSSAHSLKDTSVKTDGKKSISAHLLSFHAPPT